MYLFRRALSLFLLVCGVVVGFVVTLAAVVARRMTRPPRQRLWASPEDLNLAFEAIHFPAQDGLRVAGWFLPGPEESGRKGATIIILHGWLWNRLGVAADDAFSKLVRATPVDLLHLSHSLHRDGYNVFMVDLRNHGESADDPPVTFGLNESDDLLGAVAYLGKRADVDAERIGVIGFSLGANGLLYALSKTERIRAAVAVQPVTVSVFARRFAADMLGPLGPVALPLVELLYRAAGGLPFSALQPRFPATSIGSTPILFVQGLGDPWGSADDVTQIASAAPGAHGPLLVETSDRYGGYRYMVDNPRIATAFFEQHFPD